MTLLYFGHRSSSHHIRTSHSELQPCSRFNPQPCTEFSQPCTSLGSQACDSSRSQSHGRLRTHAHIKFGFSEWGSGRISRLQAVGNRSSFQTQHYPQRKWRPKTEQLGSPENPKMLPFQSKEAMRRLNVKRFEDCAHEYDDVSLGSVSTWLHVDFLIVWWLGKGSVMPLMSSLVVYSGCFCFSDALHWSHHRAAYLRPMIYHVLSSWILNYEGVSVQHLCSPCRRHFSMMPWDCCTSLRRSIYYYSTTPLFVRALRCVPVPNQAMHSWD